MENKFDGLELEIVEIKQMSKIISDKLVYKEDNGTDATNLVPLSSILCKRVEQLSVIQYDIIRLL